MLQKEKKVSIADLKRGMYIHRLDRPWQETSFLFQGFYITDNAQIEELQRKCDFVYIDILRGEPALRYLDDEAAASNEHAVNQALHDICDLPKPNNVYQDVVAVEEELPAAKEAHKQVYEFVANVMDDVKSGKLPKLSVVQQQVDAMMESILRNPDAFAWLNKLKQKDSYIYSHCIDSASMAIAFGRHLGLPRDELKRLGLGVLLLDVGKMHLPNGLLNKPGRLTEAEYSVVRRHVKYGVDILQKMQGITQDMIDIASTHHERYNGGGYPNRLRKNQIPLFGRIAAIVDCYDAITSDRAHQKAISPHAALRNLYAWRNIDFQDELIEQFIQCLGAYPTGTLVTLSTGEVAIIISQNRVRRLRPKVMLVLDRDKVAYDDFVTIDLDEESDGRQGCPMEIIAALEPGAYGIDAAEYYL